MKNLRQLHEDVPANHYDKSIKKNLFQRYWHNRRFYEITKVIIPVKGSYLDVGCHGGNFTQKVIQKIESKDVYGIDISTRAINYIKRRIPYGKFRVASAEKLPFESNVFDAVFCLEVLEHIDDPIAALKEIKRVLKKSGYALVLVPSDSLLFRLIWLFWNLRYPVWRHTHVNSFTNDSLEKLLRWIKFKIVFSKTFNFGMLKLVMVRK